MLYIEVFLNGLNPGVMPQDKLIMIILVTVVLNRIVVMPGVSPGVLERLRFTFTPNCRREFVPRDQVFPLFSVYSLLLLHKNK